MLGPCFILPSLALLLQGLAPRSLRDLEIVKRLGEGGYGKVNMAVDKLSGQRVAVKSTDPSAGAAEASAQPGAKVMLCDQKKFS